MTLLTSTVLAQEVIDRFTAANLTIATAESCTGGLIAGALTDISGSSAVFDRGFVTYSNEAKHEMLGVPIALISTVGAVSKEVAIKMADGALAKSGVNRSVAVTGIAGPGGGSFDKPVGLVHFAVARNDGETVHASIIFDGMDRAEVRMGTVDKALTMLLTSLG